MLLKKLILVDINIYIYIYIDTLIYFLIFFNKSTY